MFLSFLRLPILIFLFSPFSSSANYFLSLTFSLPFSLFLSPPHPPSILPSYSSLFFLPRNKEKKKRKKVIKLLLRFRGTRHCTSTSLQPKPYFLPLLLSPSFFHFLPLLLSLSPSPLSLSPSPSLTFSFFLISSRCPFLPHFPHFLSPFLTCISFSLTFSLSFKRKRIRSIGKRGY